MTTDLTAPLLLIHGDERYLIDAAVRLWRERARSAQLPVETVSAPARLAELRLSLLEMPLFDPERYVVITDPPQLSGNARKGGDGAEALAALLEDLPPTTSVCLVAHSVVAAGNPVIKAVARLGSVSLHPRPKGRDLAGWVHEAARERGVRLPPRAVEHILQVAGSDLGLIAMELDKLEALAGGRALTMAEVQELVAGDERVQTWSVMDGLLGPAPVRGAVALNSLIDEGRPVQYLLAILAGQVRELIITQSLLARPGNRGVALASELGLPPWRADRLARQARTAPPGVLRMWLRALQRLDARFKAGEVSDVDGLKNFGLAAASSVVASRSGAAR